MTTTILTHPDCLLHNNGPHHPECRERLTVLFDHLVAQQLDPWFQHLDAPLATRDDLLLAHSPEYIDMIHAMAPEEGLTWIAGDTAMNPHSLTASLRSAGAALQAVELVITGKSRNAFCAIRPPGHHAGPDSGCGFCIFNNVAIAAKAALERHGLRRVAVIDFDVHHGDGTEDIVHDDPRILFCSSFQYPYYPNRGADTVSDHIVNVPLPGGTTGATWRPAVSAAWFDRLDAFAPELILISAGFDGHREDDMAHFGLDESDYAWLTQALLDIAERHAHGRIVSVLEGGYNPQAQARSVAAHLRVLSGL
ncbi:MAG: histone deacetylase family protein [Thiotrichales bacterium]